MSRSAATGATVVCVIESGGISRCDVRQDGQTLASFEGEGDYERARAFVLRLSIRLLARQPRTGRAA